jgi:hypothetical protein
VPEQDHVVAGPGERVREATGQQRIVFADYRVGPACGHMVREQPTIVGVVVDDEKLEQSV